MRRRKKPPPPPKRARSVLIEAALLAAASGFAVRMIATKPGDPLVPMGVTQAATDSPHDYEAEEPGRGRSARRPREITRRGWTDIFWRLMAAFFGDRLPSVAGGVAFFLLLSVFPGLAAFVSLYGLFADVEMVREQLNGLRGVLPPEVDRPLLEHPLESNVAHQHGNAHRRRQT